MKRAVVFLMMLCMALSMSACGSNEASRGTYTDKEKDRRSEASDDREEGSEEDDENVTDEVEEDEPSVTETSVTGDLVFDTVDIYGNAVTQDMIKGSELVLLNLWEPWCGPCVSEMPDLKELYEKYKGKGLIILGAYTTFEMDNDAKELVDSLGITYPIIKADWNIYEYEQDYVPATFIFDGNGNLLEKNPVEGSRSYEEWEAIILRYLSE